MERAYLQQLGITNEVFTDDAESAIARLTELHNNTIKGTTLAAERLLGGSSPQSIGQLTFFYPWVGVFVDNPTLPEEFFEWSYGIVQSGRGLYATTVTAMELIGDKLKLVLERLVRAYGLKIITGLSSVPKPLKYAVSPEVYRQLKDKCTEVDLRRFTHVTNSEIAFSNKPVGAFAHHPLSSAEGISALLSTLDWKFLLPAQHCLTRHSGLQIDYLLDSLLYRTGSSPFLFQEFVFLTNFEDYMSKFESLGREMIAAGEYDELVAPIVEDSTRKPQTPAIHLARKDGLGVSIVNVSIGAAAGNTFIKSISPLRPIILFAGKCGGLRENHVIGNYIMPQGAFFLDLGHGNQNDPSSAIVQPFLPVGEIQGLLRCAGGRIHELEGRGISRRIQGGIIASTSNRLSEVDEVQISRLLPTPAIGLDMECTYLAQTCMQEGMPMGALLLIGDLLRKGHFPRHGSRVHDLYGNDHLRILFEVVRELRPEHLAAYSRSLRTGICPPGM